MIYNNESEMENALKNAKIGPGTDCNTDHQLVVVDMQVRLKKLRKAINLVRLVYIFLLMNTMSKYLTHFNLVWKLMKKNHQMKYGKKARIPPYVQPRAFFQKMKEPRIDGFLKNNWKKLKNVES